jgi:hypothetical protein
MTRMTGSLLPDDKHVREVTGATGETRDEVLATRDHEVIRRWAAERGAEPATGQPTRSGPGVVSVNDGGAGIRFNFPGAGRFRPIDWNEWLEHFDQHHLMFVYETQTDQGTPSNRYRIVPAGETAGEQGLLRRLFDHVTGQKGRQDPAR